MTNDTTNFIDTSTDDGKQLIRDENEAALSSAGDATGDAPDQPREPQVDANASQDRDDTERRVVQMSPSDAVRANIAKKFRRDNSVPFNGDHNDPEMQYGEVARQTLEPEPDAADSQIDITGDQPQAQAAAPEPKKRKIIVRGQEMELTEDEIIARASMVTAADSYLAEARDILEEAKTIRAERAGRDRRHPDGQSSTQDGQDDLVDPPTDDAQRPERGKVVEEILYSDPDKAEDALARFVDERADKKAEERQLTRLLSNDAVKSKKQLGDFVAANPDIANDENAARLIEAQVYKIYAEDIAKLGVVAEDQIPKDPKQLAYWHSFYRVHGHEVRSAAETLEEAKTRFNKWRGVVATPKPQPARQEAPRVQVNVDRTARREAIPNQPSRAVAPRPDASVQPPKKAKASDIVMQMRRQRGQMVAS